MDSFTQREDAFERAFSHQETLRFKARSRRNRLAASWAGETQGLVGTALSTYIENFVTRGLAAPDEALIADLVSALSAQGVSEHRVRRRLEALEAQARLEIQSGRLSTSGENHAAT